MSPLRRNFMRTFQLRTLIDIPDLVYMYDDTKQVVSTYGHGFTSSLGTAMHHGFTWNISPDDVWLYILQQATPYLDITSPSSVVSGLVYEQCVNILFDQIICPHKHIYNMDFTTSTYASKMAAKIALLATQDQTTFPWSNNILSCRDTFIPSISLQGTKQDWQKIPAMLAELPDIPFLTKVGPCIDAIINEASLPELGLLTINHSGLSSFKVAEGLEVVSGFVGAIINDENNCISPNITWYVKRYDHATTTSVQPCSFTYIR